jgi:hypothetical protein
MMKSRCSPANPAATRLAGSRDGDRRKCRDGMAHVCFWQIVLKNSPTSSSGRLLRNIESITAEKLNHPCAREPWHDRILGTKSACGVFQQYLHKADVPPTMMRSTYGNKTDSEDRHRKWLSSVQAVTGNLRKEMIRRALPLVSRHTLKGVCARSLMFGILPEIGGQRFQSYRHPKAPPSKSDTGRTRRRVECLFLNSKTPPSFWDDGVFLGCGDRI